MKRTDVVIIGGGQAGLAMSRSLLDRGIDHVVLERGRVGERWRSERWDSLRLLTPRWMSRLPGWSYTGPDPDGFMTMPEVIGYLEDYSRSFPAPIRTGVTVGSVERSGGLFMVTTDAGTWQARNVVIATGHCGRPNVPEVAAGLSPEIEQLAPTRYRNPGQLRDFGVLVVGASATGIQLALEIARSGRSVTIAVGRHTRLPRRYRGRDILAWFDLMGVLTETERQVADIEASRRQPSLQLVGSDDHHSIDLNVLQDAGIRITGRIALASGFNVGFEDNLAAATSRAELRMHEQLNRVDRFIRRSGIEAAFPVEHRPQPIRLHGAPHRIDLAAERIGTVIWATGYRNDFPWLRVPVLDPRGGLMHDGGVTPEPGLYALGLHFMRRRNSSFLDGVGADAADLADHIVRRMARRQPAAA